MEIKHVEKKNCQDSAGAVNPQEEWQGCHRSIRVGCSRVGTSHYLCQEQEIQGDNPSPGCRGGEQVPGVGIDEAGPRHRNGPPDRQSRAVGRWIWVKWHCWGRG